MGREITVLPARGESRYNARHQVRRVCPKNGGQRLLKIAGEDAAQVKWSFQPRTQAPEFCRNMAPRAFASA